MPETQEDRSSLGQDLNNSVQLDESLRLPQTEQHEELLDSYISNIIEFHGLTNRRDVRRGLGHTLSVVFANLSKARGLGDKFIAVSLGSGAYTNSRYNDNDLSYLNVKRVIDYLSRDQGEVEIYRGFRDESTGEGRNTRIRLRQEEGIEGEENTPEEDRLRGGEVLEEILEASSSQSPSLLSITSRALEIPVSLLPPSSPFEVMRLKDGSGSTSNLIDYHDDEWIIAERHRLEEWNRFSVTHWADIFLPQDVFSNLRESVEEEASDNSPADLEIDLTKRTLYRVFNHGSWESGGRLYGGWWQRIPSDLRKFITINGQPTCEWDFSNMQIAMLYAREGLPLESRCIFDRRD